MRYEPMDTVDRKDRVLPEGLRRLIDDELQEGETLWWTGQPIGKRAAWRALPGVLFAIPWTGFAVYWVIGASGFQWPGFPNGFNYFSLFGMLFVLIGLYVLGSPIWAMRKAKRTAYALTDRRVIIVESGRSTRVRSYRRHQITELSRKQRVDGSGDVILAHKTRTDSEGDKFTTDVGFLDIPDVKAVEVMVRDMMLLAGDAGQDAAV